MDVTASFNPAEQSVPRGASARYELTITNPTDSDIDVWTQYRWSGNQTILPAEIRLTDGNGSDVALIENANTQYVLPLRRETVSPGRSTCQLVLRVRSPWVTEVECSIEIWPSTDTDAPAPFYASGVVILTPAPAAA
ncbi:hypothetical protein BH09ACT9_BH09ACT9_53610 [soil metagenome]